MARGLRTRFRGAAARAVIRSGDAIRAQAALRLAKRDLEIHHTVGTIYTDARTRERLPRIPTTSTCCRKTPPVNGRAPIRFLRRLASACRSRPSRHDDKIASRAVRFW
jgi:hypothetical protein